MVRRALAGVVFALALSGCATLTQPGPGGTLTGKLVVQWAGENQFIYLPEPGIAPGNGGGAQHVC